MVLGVVQETTAGSFGTAKSKAQAAGKNADGSFAAKLWYGSKEADARQTDAAETNQTAASRSGASQTTAVNPNTGKETVALIDYSEFFQEKINEIFVKVLNGETEPSYQIGSRSFTEKDWKNFLKKFDSVQDAIRKLMREEHAKRAAKKLKSRQTFMARQKKSSVTDQSSLLFADSTACVYPSASEKEEATRYVTWYTEEGIFCRSMGQTEEEEWSLAFWDPQQYDKVMELIGQFPSDWNLRFAAHENFWMDFLNGDLDTERFLEYMKGTKQGVPNLIVTEDGSTSMDRDYFEWAKYLNSFGNEFYTGAEFQKKWEMEIAANAAKRIKISNPYDEKYKDAEISGYTSGQLYCEYPGGPLYTAAEMEKRMWEAYLQTKNGKGRIGMGD